MALCGNWHWYLLDIILGEHHSWLGQLGQVGVTSAMAGLFQPTSPQPRSSASTNTIFGRLSAAGPQQRRRNRMSERTNLIGFILAYYCVGGDLGLLLGGAGALGEPRPDSGWPGALQLLWRAVSRLGSALWSLPVMSNKWFLSQQAPATHPGLGKASPLTED